MLTVIAAVHTGTPSATLISLRSSALARPYSLTITVMIVVTHGRFLSMRQEKLKIELPTVNRALHELLIPSIPLKLVRGSETGRPDDLFLIPYGRGLFIEFKWGEEEPSPKQIYWRDEILGKLGYDVQIHNNVQLALEAIAVEVVAASLHAEGGEILARARRGDFDARSRFAEDLHYARSFQFLEKAARSSADAGDRTAKGVLSGLARRD